MRLIAFFCFLLGMALTSGIALYFFRKNKAILEQAFKDGHAELNQAVSMLKHDLNSPLTAIILGLQSLEKEECSPKVTKVLGILASSASQMKVLIQESSDLTLNAHSGIEK